MCMSHPQMCVSISPYFNPVGTAWPLMLPRDQLCWFFSQALIPFALFHHPKINSELSLLSSQYSKQVIHVVAQMKRKELEMLEQHSGKQREKRDKRREEKERLVLKFVSLVPSYFFPLELG